MVMLLSNKKWIAKKLVNDGIELYLAVTNDYSLY